MCARTQVGALDLGDGVVLQLVLEAVGGVQPEALPGGGAPRAAGALLRAGLADGRHDQRLHARLGAVAVLLAEARVDDVLRAHNFLVSTSMSSDT